jgi:hypothetical protein
MNGGIIPLLLLSVTLGLMLAFATTRLTIVGLAAFASVALLAFAAPIALASNSIFIGLWLTIIAAAALVYLPVARWRHAIIPLCLNAGLWLGAYAALSGDRRDFALGLIPALIAIPAKWLVRRRLNLGLKVVASWVIAIASLALFVSLMPSPGYKPDHME